MILLHSFILFCFLKNSFKIVFLSIWICSVIRFIWEFSVNFLKISLLSFQLWIILLIIRTLKIRLGFQTILNWLGLTLRRFPNMFKIFQIINFSLKIKVRSNFESKILIKARGVVSPIWVKLGHCSIILSFWCPSCLKICSKSKGSY